MTTKKVSEKVETKVYKNFPGGLRTIKEYEDLIPPMDQDAFNQLLENIKKDGIIRDPLTIDGDVILDGHNRYKIASILDMTFKTIEKKFESTEDGVLWIINNQIGRRKMSKSQLAILALRLVPYYAELCKKRQSQAGKTRGKGQAGAGEVVKKGVKTSYLAAKKVGVNETIVKHAIALQKSFPAILPLIKLNVLSIAEAKDLQEKKINSELKEIIIDGKLTEDANNELCSLRGILTEAQAKTRKEKADKRKADKERKDAEAKAEAEKKAKAEAEAEAEAKRIQEGGIPVPGSNENLPIDVPPEGGPEVKKAPEIVNTKDMANYVETQKLGTVIVLKVKKKGAFTDKVKFIDATKDTEQITTGFFAELKMGRDSFDYPPNIVMLIPNTILNVDYIQQITSASDLYCDSKNVPARILYFGKEVANFYNILRPYGNISTIVHVAPADKTPPKVKPKAKVKTRVA